MEIRAEMMSHGVVPSEAIRRLKRLADMLDWRRNAFFAPVAVAVSWALHLASAIESWRREFGPKVIAWLAAVAEYEALSSLAAYAYEHADDPFPIFVEDGGPARFEGASLGHPLVPAARMVRNDVFLTPQTRLLIVSGSNMSGKSTLLRTVGVNVVLAMAGAPVRAASAHADAARRGRDAPRARLASGGALAILRGDFPHPQRGRSRRTAPHAGIAGLLFLLDELFQGTNSHDRKIGAEALLLSLIDRGAIGLTTTHDLALTAIAEQSGGRAVNVHFEDELKDGELIFDYRMKPGPVTHSNALALMKAVGLPVQHHWQIGRSVDWKTSIRLVFQSHQSSNPPIYQFLRPATSLADVTPFRNPRLRTSGTLSLDRDAARIAGRALAQLPRSAIHLDAADAVAVPDWSRCSSRCARRRGSSGARRAPAATGGCWRCLAYCPNYPAAPLLLPRPNPTARIDEMRSFQPSDRRSSIVP